VIEDKQFLFLSLFHVAFLHFYIFSFRFRLQSSGWEFGCSCELYSWKRWWSLISCSSFCGVPNALCPGVKLVNLKLDEKERAYFRNVT